MEAPLRTEETTRWADRRSGPREAIIRPRSKLLRTCFEVAEKLPRPYAGYLRAAGVRALSRSPVQLETAWGRLLAPRRDHMFFRPVFDEPLETAVVTRVLQPGMHVLDIGANRGWFAVLMSRCIGPDGSVLGFEPDPTPRRQLLANIAANDLSNVEILPHALGGEAGEFRFVAERESALSHLARDGEAAGEYDITVAVRRLDDVLAERPGLHVDFVKIDVEGAEIAVLRGAAGLLSGPDAPVLLVEIEEHHQSQYGARSTDLVELLGDAYACYRLCWQHGTAERFPDEACPSGRNLLCIPTARADEVLARVFA